MSISGYDADVFDAVEYGDYEQVQCLIDNGNDVDRFIDINVQDTRGTTLLMLAAYSGFTNIVRLLLGRGADPNLKDNQGRTALMQAKQAGQTHIIELLQQSGAIEA